MLQCNHFFLMGGTFFSRDTDDGSNFGFTTLWVFFFLKSHVRDQNQITALFRFICRGQLTKWANQHWFVNQHWPVNLERFTVFADKSHEWTNIPISLGYYF